MNLPYRADETLDNNQEFPHIDHWTPEPEDCIAVPDNMSMVVYFNKIFPNTGFNATLNTFNVGRKSYAIRLPEYNNTDGSVDKGICHHINYFIKFYDEDKELLMAYLKLKYVLDRKDSKPMKPKKFNKLLQHILYTDTIIEKLTRLSEANYIIDLTQDEADTNKYHKSLQFTNEHAKILMSISYMMKLVAPVIYHYIGKMKDSKIDIYPFYEPLFYLMSPEHINIWNKLFITALSNYNYNLSRNRHMWDDQEIFGRGRDSAMENLIKYKLVVDNLFKYTYSKSIVNFNSVILKNQLRYYNKENYGCDLREISVDKPSGGSLSGKDKFEMAAKKIDESRPIFSKLNIKRTIAKIQKQLNVEIDDAELKYYMDNMVIDDFRVMLVNYIFAKHFNGFADLESMKRKDYVKLFVILKKDLAINKGYEYLPEIITGMRISKLNTRTIQNNKFISKIKESNTWNALMNEKFSVLKYLGKEDLLLNILSTIINTTFGYCDYDRPFLYGEIIDYGRDELSNEFLNLMWFI